MNFSFLTLQFQCAASSDPVLHSARALNVLRGALGAALRQSDCAGECRDPKACPLIRQCRYRRWFAPSWPEGPSGYREAPRPFVLRTVAAAAFQLIVFATSWPLAEITDAMIAAFQHLAGGQTPKLSAIEHFNLPTDVIGEAASYNDTLRICFDTPIELKNHGVVIDCPEFSVLIDRLAERVWALGTLYNGWPANFGQNLPAALFKQVKLIDYDWRRTELPRRSSLSNTIHSLGGFTGWADYRGPIAPFLPLLSIGVWTGVGRQTVWGKGAFHLESSDALTTPNHPTASAVPLARLA